MDTIYPNRMREVKEDYNYGTVLHAQITDIVISKDSCKDIWEDVEITILGGPLNGQIFRRILRIKDE